MPELELELTEPLEDCRPELLLPALVEPLDVVVPVDEEAPALVEEWLDVAPGIVDAPTTPKTARAPTAESATPAVTWLIRPVARSRA
jgi:hypothetical protein